ncbi:MAG: helix-turn-helix transcriptional regulator [Clostridia bacterium]|nr:helix-turn-helix transcriptional regulator [Clostridia bacterium]
MKELVLKNLSVSPVAVHLYVPPIVWKGDSIGHLGEDDVFFWVLEGECFLKIDSQSYIVRPGQLAFLPKGKFRAYTHVSERFSMYEMGFDVMINGQNLMSLLGLDKPDFVVDIEDIKEMSALFENSNRKELRKNPIYDVAWCANIINIIHRYAEQRKKHFDEDRLLFKPVLDYMSQNMDKTMHIESLAALVYMQPTYFIKKFKNVFGLTPIAYLNRDRMFRAMSLLSQTRLPVSQIAVSTGFADVSYFARVFKKHCGVSPSEYRNEFNKQTFLY